MMEEFFSKRMLSKKNYIIIGTVVLLLTILTIQILFDKEITFVDTNKKITIHTTSSNVFKALKKADITLNEYDRLSVGMDQKLEDAMTIYIYRAFPLKINVDGKELDVLTAHNRVSDVLKQYNIQLNEEDKVEPSLESQIKSNDVINVIRVEEENVTATEEIPYKSIFKYSDKIEFNEQRKVQEGKMGKKEVDFKITYENGVEVSREILDERIIEEPIDEIIEKGSEKYLVASRGKVVRYKKALIMSSTAYDLSYESCGKTPDHPEYGITFSGTKARPGVVAVDPKVIPLGTRLYVEALDGSEDYGFAVAEDTGSAIKGNKIDLFMENHRDAWRYGRRNVRVYILE